jgi:hypothetical protein
MDLHNGSPVRYVILPQMSPSRASEGSAARSSESVPGAAGAVWHSHIAPLVPDPSLPSEPALRNEGMTWDAQDNIRGCIIFR